MAPQFRQNPITKNWVLIAPGRNKRPDEYRQQAVMRGMLELDPACVFCPGNEFQNEESYRDPDSADWELRIIPNKYPALERAADGENHDFHYYASRVGYGVHEVIITRRHNEPVALQSAGLLERTLLLFQRRMRELGQDERLSYVSVFHNHGHDAGGSLVHPHYQLMAVPLVPPHVHAEVAGAGAYFAERGTDVYGDIIGEECKSRERLVTETDHFAVVSAYASRSPFETWVVPKRQVARFEEATPDEIRHLAQLLKLTLGQLHTKLNDPPLNFYIHTLPLKGRGRPSYDERSFRWHLTIFPRITIWAGFEYATGIPVNPVSPETTAQFLRT